MYGHTPIFGDAIDFASTQYTIIYSKQSLKEDMEPGYGVYCKTCQLETLGKHSCDLCTDVT
jgi:hypothetical protein